MKKSNIYILFLSLFVAFGLSSCLNDPNIENQKYGLINLNANKIIEIPSDASHAVSKTLLPSGIADVTIGEVRLAAEEPAAEDIVVTLSTVKSDTTQYALLRGKELFPLNQITVPTTVTIPKGQRSVPLVVKVNTDALLPDPQYLAVSVSSMDKQGYIISGNFGDLTLSFKIKHKYEGRYICTGTFADVTNAAWSHASGALKTNYGEDLIYDLETVDGSTLIIGYSPTFDASNRFYFFTGSAFSYYGSFCPKFTFDTSGNITAVTNAYGQPATNTRSAQLDPTGVNKYDEATKSFTVSYWMNQPSVVAAPPHHRTKLVETYTFVEDL